MTYSLSALPGDWLCKVLQRVESPVLEATVKRKIETIIYYSFMTRMNNSSISLFIKVMQWCTDAD
jgi:hypothetical protein